MDKVGRIPGDVLDSTVAGVQCSRQEVELMRLLLARVPADRAWRRRRWLFMLRWRASKQEAERSDDLGSPGGNSSAAGRVQHWSHGRENNGGGEGVEACGAEAGGGNLSGLVWQLLGLELEGVFRGVVRFL